MQTVMRNPHPGRFVPPPDAAAGALPWGRQADVP